MKTHIAILIGLAFGLASCGIPPSPAVTAHAGGALGGAGVMGMAAGGGQPVVSMEAAKSQSFWH